MSGNTPFLPHISDFDHFASPIFNDSNESSLLEEFLQKPLDVEQVSQGKPIFLPKKGPKSAKKPPKTGHLRAKPKKCAASPHKGLTRQSGRIDGESYFIRRVSGVVQNRRSR